MIEAQVKQTAELHVQPVADGRLDDAFRCVVDLGLAEIRANLTTVVYTVRGASVEAVNLTDEAREANVFLRFETASRDVVIDSHSIEEAEQRCFGTHMK